MRKEAWKRPEMLRAAMKFLFGGSAFLVAAATVWAIAALRNVPQPLILHFARVAITETGTLANLVGVGIVGLTVVALNFFLARAFFDRERMLSYLISGTTLAFSLLIFLGFRAIILVNSP